MKVNILEDDINKRNLFKSPNSVSDYLTDEIRRIFPIDDNINLRNSAFEEPIVLCLDKGSVKITIENCYFKNGLFIRRGLQGVDYTMFIFKTNICDMLAITSVNYAVCTVNIDTCQIDKVFISDRIEKIDLFASKIEVLSMQNLKGNIFRLEQTKIRKYNLASCNFNEVEIDTDNLAISDYSRFINTGNHTKKQVSELYHRFVLKAAKSIKSVTEINYELTKATSNWTSFLFGYFFKPLQVILWIIGIIIFYSGIYKFVFDVCYNKALYFSVYTFLTIGFSDIGNPDSLLKTVLVFSEGLLGVLYSAVLLTSIINSSKK